MKKDWVNECINGAKPLKPVPESKASVNVRAILGERAERPPEPDASTRPPPAPTPTPTREVAPPAPDATGEAEDTIPAEGDVASLVSGWESGSHTAVAQRVLAGLDSYRDFVSLVYQIGQDGALELASLMDELSSGGQASSEDDIEGEAALPRSRQPEGELEEPVSSPDDQPIR